MRILFGTSHPKHVYIFKNVIINLMKRGHEVKVVAVKKEITEYLLKKFDLPCTVIGKNQPKLYRKLAALPKWEYLTFKIAREFKPDIFIGRALPHLAHVSAIFRKPFILFEDTEHATKVQKICLPFADVVVTPDCYKRSFKGKHIRFKGYYEHAYLHPKYFKPDPSVLDDLGLSKGDKFVIIRLVSWEAAHDIHSRGFSEDFLEKAIKSLEEYGHVFITSERKLNKNLEKYKIPIAPEKLHSALYYASLYFGEGGTTATESALLGTPSVHVEGVLTRSGELKDVIQALNIGVRDELVNKYGLCYTFADQYLALNKALEILDDNNAKRKQKEKLKKVLEEKIDVTKFMTDFIERYPESYYEYINSKKRHYESKKTS